MLAPSSRALRAALFLTLAAGCADRPASEPVGPEIELGADRGPAPPPMVPIALDGGNSRLWPFASASLETPDDPINLIFTGAADPRQIRNALLGLDGGRGAPFPPVFPFTCTWSDAIGGLMAGYGEDAGWAPGAVQLQCGSYGPIRFHLRLFDMGPYTAANAHFEVVIPGTADHQVLSWELAEQLVTYDVARTGLITSAPGATALINPAPTHRVIPAPVYNGLPAELRALIGGPAVPSADVGIQTDGRATILALSGESPPAPARTTQRFELTYGQVIPKPFCGTGPADYLLVEGPVELAHDVAAADGYRATFTARGRLQVTPIDAATGAPAGPTRPASVSEWQQSTIVGGRGAVEGLIQQALAPAPSDGPERLTIQVQVRDPDAARYRRHEVCR